MMSPILSIFLKSNLVGFIYKRIILSNRSESDLLTIEPDILTIEPDSLSFSFSLFFYLFILTDQDRLRVYDVEQLIQIKQENK